MRPQPALDETALVLLPAELPGEPVPVAECRSGSAKVATELAAAAVGAGLLQRSLFRGGSAAAMAGGSLAAGFARGAAVEDGVPAELEAGVVGVSGVGAMSMPVDTDFGCGEHGSRAGGSESGSSGARGSSWAMMRLKATIASSSSSAAMSTSAKGSWSSSKHDMTELGELSGVAGGSPAQGALWRRAEATERRHGLKQHSARAG